MTEYGNYENRSQALEQINHLKTNADGKNIQPSDERKISEASQKINSIVSSVEELGNHKFELKQTNSRVSNETNLIAKTIILPESKQDNSKFEFDTKEVKVKSINGFDEKLNEIKEENTQENITTIEQEEDIENLNNEVAINQEVSDFKINENSNIDIKSMNEDEIMEALDNPENYTDEQIDEMSERLADILSGQEEIIKEKQENIENEKKSIEDQQESIESEQESVENNQESIENEQEIIENTTQETSESNKNKSENLSEFSKEFKIEKQQEVQSTDITEKTALLGRNVMIMTSSGLRPLNIHSFDKEKIVSFDQDTGILSASKENLKNFSLGQKVLFIDENGLEKFLEIKGFEELSEEQIKALYTFIESHYHVDLNIKKEQIGKKEQESTNNNFKSKNSGKTEKEEVRNKTFRNEERINLTQTIKDELSSTERFNLERLKKYEKVQKEESKIRKEIEKLEILVREINKNELSREIKKLIVQLDEINSQNNEILNECTKILKEFKKNNIKIPLATRLKFKEVELATHANEKIISKLRKTVMIVSYEQLNTNNIQRIGTDTEA